MVTLTGGRDSGLGEVVRPVSSRWWAATHVSQVKRPTALGFGWKYLMLMAFSRRGKAHFDRLWKVGPLPL